MSYPSNWQTVSIGDSLGLINGRAFKPVEWTRTGMPIIRIQNLNNPESHFNYYEGKLPEKFRVTKGDLLFAWSGTPGTSFGAHLWRGEDAWLNQHIFKVTYRPAQFDKKFLQLAINQNLHEYVQVAHGGAGLAHITKGKFESSILPVPPLAEQRRIVGKIEALFSELDAGVANLKQARAQLAVYRQALLKHAFEGHLTADWRTQRAPNLESADQLLERITELAADFTPSREDQLSVLPPVPSGWIYTYLSNLGELGRGKSKHRPRNDPALFGGPYPFLQTGEVKAANGTIRNYQHTYSEFGLKQSKLWPSGTLCITIAANIAETAFLGFDACFPDSVVGFTPNQGAVFSEFVELFIRSAKTRIAAYAPATAQKNINLETLENLLVPLPSLEEQKEIVSTLGNQLSVIDTVEADIDLNLQKAEALRQSILKKAFAGELVPQDPADEPAAALLARIRAEREADAAAPKLKKTRTKKA